MLWSSGVDDLGDKLLCAYIIYAVVSGSREGDMTSLSMVVCLREARANMVTYMGHLVGLSFQGYTGLYKRMSHTCMQPMPANLA